MTETEIQELETATGCILPAAYRELLLNYPQRLMDLAATLGVEELELLTHNHESLTRMNVDQAEYVRMFFPPYYFVIGENGNGDVYAIDTQSPAVPVYMGGPHPGEYPEDAAGNPLPDADSLQEYVEYVVFLYEDAIQYESELDDTRVYQPPGKLMETLSVCLSLLLAPVMLLLLLFSMIIAVPYFLLLELWDKVRPAKD
ncbi:SMI1 / KNR4 family protein [Gimesia chilikensis]|uniref:SMI1 / KNR4 family protein n=2 Tax=Gimesia chilikensis TaxID=2605989 RepID=A0A517WMU7_9PLAN|nr:SMI1 / KNR4 family protein [Gimesia chilikensis]